MSDISTQVQELPGRFEKVGALSFSLYVMTLAFVVWSFTGAGWSFTALADGVPYMWDFLTRSWPPSLERIDAIGIAILETFQMAIVGTVMGILLSIPLAIFGASGLTDLKIPFVLARGIVALFRTVPDLVWALIFVITVGLGPFAGTLAIMVDTIGFCGRFFAESMEDVDKAPSEALAAAGASKTDTIFAAVVPAAMPSFITTSLFALEKSTRSSVILGLVGAGGVGIELKVAMDFFNYPLAMTIILMIFVLVLLVERLSAYARKKVFEG